MSSALVRLQLASCLKADSTGLAILRQFLTDEVWLSLMHRSCMFLQSSVFAEGLTTAIYFAREFISPLVSSVMSFQSCSCNEDFATTVIGAHIISYLGMR